VPKDGQWLAEGEMFFKVLKEAKIDILIYSPKGDLQDILGLEKKGKQTIIHGFKFSLIYSIAPYFVYSVERVNSVK